MLMGMGHAFEHRHAQRRDIVGRCNQIGHHHGAHSCRMGRPDPGNRILERHAMDRIDVQPPRRRQIRLGMGFWIDDVVAGDDGLTGTASAMRIFMEARHLSSNIS